MADAPKILGTDTLRQAYPKLNDAIVNSNEALKKSTIADTRSSTAINTANQAKGTAENTQKQLNDIIVESGTSDAEVIQARGSATVLNERLNDMDARMTETAYYHGVTYQRKHDDVSGTDYQVTYIPHTDENGNIVKLERGFAGDAPGNGKAETAREFAARSGTTGVFNAATFNTTTFLPNTLSIFNGEVIKDTTNTAGRYILGIKDDNTLVYYPPSTTAAEILADGTNNALTAFTPLVIGGSAANSEMVNSNSNATERHPRQVIGQFQNKDIIFLTAEGRSDTDAGMTADDLIRVLLDEGVYFAYMLDGGGSTQTVIKNTLINEVSDSGGIQERAVPDFLYVKKETQVSHQDLFSTAQDIGELDKRTKDLVRQAQMFKLTKDNGRAERFQAGIDLNDITDAGFYFVERDLPNVPVANRAGQLVVIPNYDEGGLQIFYPYNGNTDLLSEGHWFRHWGIGAGAWGKWTKTRTARDPQEILWSGAVYPSDTQTITPTKKLSECMNGWALVWSDYDRGVGANDFHFCTTFVPKAQGTFASGKGSLHVVGSGLSASENTLSIKALYITDTTITGDANNAVSVNNSDDVCLRYVLEM